jgi:hypothetical protein
LLDIQRGMLEVDVLPPKAEQLAAACARQEGETDKRAVWSRICRGHHCAGLLSGRHSKFAPSRTGRLHPVGWVPDDHLPPNGLSESRVEDLVISKDRPGRQPPQERRIERLDV